MTDTASHTDIVELQVGDMRLAVRPDLGGCIAGLWHRDAPVLRSTEPSLLQGPRQSACFPLVPYSNRLGHRRFEWQGRKYTTLPNFDDSPHSLHGVAWQSPWHVVSGRRDLGGIDDARNRATVMEHRMDIEALPLTPSLLGESPLWHPSEQVLYWCDIPGRCLNRWEPAGGQHAQWHFDSEPGCCAAVRDGGLLLALREGIVHFDPATGRRVAIAGAPYDPSVERFNDGKTDPQGRFWVGTIYEPRDAARATLYRLADAGLERMADGITTSNGLAWSPDARTMYWADTKAHVVYAFDFDAAGGSLSNRRVFLSFAPRRPGGDLADYGGRPDGAALDMQGCYWIAMFEGARVLRVSPQGEVLQELPLPVRCPTMPCFGGADLKTLYITTGRENRSADELAREPLAGCVLQLRVEVPGLPTNFVHLTNIRG